MNLGLDLMAVMSRNATVEYVLTYILLYFDLEDKITFRWVGNDMISVCNTFLLEVYSRQPGWPSVLVLLEDISDGAIDFGVWPKSDNIRDHIAPLDSKQSFMVEYIGLDKLICNHIKHAPLVCYWSHEKSSWKFERLIYLAFGGLQGFAYNHKDLADAIHTFDVGHCLGNALVVTKIDSYEIHLAVLSTENYGMENWDLLQASFANNATEVLKAWLHNIVCTMVGAVDCQISFEAIGQNYFRKFSISCHFNIGQQQKYLGNVEKINGDPKAELIKMVQKQFVLFFRSGREQQWDPGGYLSTSASASWSPFKVWDPGKKNWFHEQIVQP